MPWFVTAAAFLLLALPLMFRVGYRRRKVAALGLLAALSLPFLMARAPLSKHALRPGVKVEKPCHLFALFIH